MSEILIGGRRIGQGHPPFIIAEMSGNHNQSLDRALAIVDAAAASGAHALKLQTYTADTMTLDLDDREFLISDPESLWRGTSLYKLYQEAHTPWEWHRAIFERCRERGLICFSTPFDETAVDFLEGLAAPCYKIASFENHDLPLIRKVAATGKPVIISTGMATLAEIDDAVRTARDAGCRELVLLKCTSSYPAPPEDANLRVIPALREAFGTEVGLSDHTTGTAVAAAAVALGATVIEKHFTLDRADGGVDAAFSAEPREMRSLVADCTTVWAALGSVTFGPVGREKESLKFRRSLYVVADVEKGELFTPSNVRLIRPGYGLPSKFIDCVFGRRASRSIAKGTPVAWDLLV